MTIAHDKAGADAADAPVAFFRELGLIFEGEAQMNSPESIVETGKPIRDWQILKSSYFRFPSIRNG